MSIKTKTFDLMDLHRMLRGDITFYGSTHIDEVSVENLEHEAEVLYNLIEDIVNVHNETKGRYESSAEAINEATKKMLVELATLIEDTLTDDE